jgi:hypothetical protein
MHAGIVVGAILLIAIALLSIHCIRLLIATGKVLEPNGKAVSYPVS